MAARLGRVVVAARPHRARAARRSRTGGVPGSGVEGRWTLTAAVDEGVPAPVLATALFNRFSSRGDDDYANRILAAMRHEFGGHVEKPAAGEGGGAAR